MTTLRKLGSHVTGSFSRDTSIVRTIILLLCLGMLPMAAYSAEDLGLPDSLQVC